MNTLVFYYPYLAIIGVAFAWYFLAQRKAETKSVAIKVAAVEAGLGEPVSLHPIIDPAICLGCGTCVRACPEGDILGIINNKAELIEPTHCIGHGACKTACPTDAITLVFGTAKRGVDLPVVGPDFQTNVPGIYIAGELGGMGLIRNAFTQGQQAVDAIAKSDGRRKPGQFDVVIVGAGPAGIAAALGAKEKGLSYLVIEQDDLGGTVFKYPRAKVVMTAPAKLPLVGAVNFKQVSKENLLEFWKKIEQDHDLQVRYRERVEKISARSSSFSIETTGGTYLSGHVLLAIGRRGTPRQLGVAGEDQEKVVYQMIDPEQYRGQHVLVVGGGDSALEAATSIAEQPGSTVTLAYRGEAFGRARSANRDKADTMAQSGQLTLLMSTEVQDIGKTAVTLRKQGKTATLQNDAVIVCAGGILPTDFLKSCGIAMETKFGTA